MSNQRQEDQTVRTMEVHCGNDESDRKREIDRRGQLMGLCS